MTDLELLENNIIQSIKDNYDKWVICNWYHGISSPDTLTYKQFVFHRYVDNYYIQYNDEVIKLSDRVTNSFMELAKRKTLKEQVKSAYMEQTAIEALLNEWI